MRKIKTSGRKLNNRYIAHEKYVNNITRKNKTSVKNVCKFRLGYNRFNLTEYGDKIRAKYNTFNIKLKVLNILIQYVFSTKERTR